jgi:hypothetical protein
MYSTTDSCICDFRILYRHFEQASDEQAGIEKQVLQGKFGPYMYKGFRKSARGFRVDELAWSQGVQNLSSPPEPGDLQPRCSGGSTRSSEPPS